LLIPLCAVDTRFFHSRRGEFSTINPQAFPVITHRLDYTEFEKGFELMRSGQSGKIVLKWSE